jgi:hypothetical protein
MLASKDTEDTEISGDEPQGDHNTRLGTYKNLSISTEELKEHATAVVDFLSNSHKPSPSFPYSITVELRGYLSSCTEVLHGEQDGRQCHALWRNLRQH